MRQLDVTVSALALAALALLAVSVGCQGGDSESTQPIDLHVVCPASSDGGPGCPAEARLQPARGWLDRIRYRPGSTLTLWTWSEDGARRAFRACVPESWGSNVMARQAAFIKKVRSSLGSETPGGESVGGDTCETGGDGRTRQLTVLDAEGESRDWTARSRDADPTPVQTAIVCDYSNSTVGRACTEQTLRRSFCEWARRAFDAPGSSIRLYVVGRNRSDTEMNEPIQVDGTPIGRRVATLLAAADRFVDSLPDERFDNASAIAEATDVAVDHLQSTSGRAELVVQSDLRQVSGRWNFEQRAPETRAFRKWLADRRLLGDLHGIAVEACGLHHRSGPDAANFDGKRARRIRDVWQHVLEDMGARAVELTDRCPS
ncbi:MAG: hypothetical protein ABEL76_00800 [Bradymonadaceae bacterium]